MGAGVAPVRQVCLQTVTAILKFARINQYTDVRYIRRPHNLAVVHTS